jgi:hypothetical protein
MAVAKARATTPRVASSDPRQTELPKSETRSGRDAVRATSRYQGAI